MSSGVDAEETNQKAYYQEQNSPMLVDYLNQELEQRERILVENDHWLCVVPFWAVWPFELLLLPKRHVLRMPDLSSEERKKGSWRIPPSI